MFLSRQIYQRRLTDTLQRLYNIDQLTTQQTQVIEAFGTSKDILIRQPTGTGKTLGILLALLRNPSPPASTLFVVPNRELALQIEQWAHSLVADRKYHVLQRFVSGTEFEPHQKKVLRRHGPPSIVLGTPKCLLERPPVDFSQIRQVVVDEVDQLIKLPNKYASRRQIEMRLKKPRPGQLLVDKVLEEGRRRGSEIRVVSASATCNSQLRNWMYQHRWLQPNNTQEVTELASNSKIKHYCLVIENADTVRNFQPAPAKTNSHFDSEQHSVWEQDVMKRTEKEHLQVMEIMAEVVWNVLQQMDTPGSVLLFTRSDAHSTQFKDILRTLYHLEVHDIMDRFHNKDKDKDKDKSKGKIYLATEESARGLDLPDISLVLVIDVPRSTASYQHLSGRTGRLNCRFPDHCQVVTIVPMGRMGWYESKMRSIYSHLHITPLPLSFIS